MDDGFSIFWLNGEDYRTELCWKSSNSNIQNQYEQLLQEEGIHLSVLMYRKYTDFSDLDTLTNEMLDEKIYEYCSEDMKNDYAIDLKK